MSMAQDSSDAQERSPQVLRQFSPRQVALLIRALDSRLISIDYQPGADEGLLSYTFEVAGRQQTFRLAVPRDALESIADLYPEAAAHEQNLGQRGLTFRRRSED
jgi:hypothetical protein